jgi:hypothetical protein
MSCLLMHVGAAQACARLQERQCVRPAAHGGRFHPNPAQHVSTVPQVKFRVLGCWMSRSLDLTVLFGHAPTTELCH